MNVNFLPCTFLLRLISKPKQAEKHMSLFSPQSHQQMSARQRRMLMDMGIDVWTSRSSSPIVAEVGVPVVAAASHALAEIKASLAEASGGGAVRALAADVASTQAPTATATPVEKPEVLQTDRIHLYFAKKANVLYISEAPISAPSQSFVQDLLLCRNWSVTSGELEVDKK